MNKNDVHVSIPGPRTMVKGLSRMVSKTAKAAVKTGVPVAKDLGRSFRKWLKT